MKNRLDEGLSLPGKAKKIHNFYIFKQGVNQKITIGTVRPQLGKQALECPNVAGGVLGVL